MTLTFGEDRVCSRCRGIGFVAGRRCVVCQGSGMVRTARNRDTGTVFDQPRPVARTGDPDTSWEAAESIEGRRIRESQGWILDLLKEHGPLTDEDLWKMLQVRHAGKISPSGARTRRAELVRAGLVRDSGKREIGTTGRRMIVWEGRA